jgi:hypothetical protein
LTTHTGTETPSTSSSVLTFASFDAVVTGKATSLLRVISLPNLFDHCTNDKLKGNSDFENYEDVTDLFTEHDVERPPFLYLGPNKTFYTRVADGTEKWKLSNEITCNGLQVTSNAVRSAAESLWLGVEGAWVAQYRDTRFRFDLKGQYKGLEKVMRKKQDEEVSINALALNVTDGRSYACVFNDGTVVYEAGRARFDGKEFEYWCEQNFRFTQRLTFA